MIDDLLDGCGAQQHFGAGGAEMPMRGSLNDTPPASELPFGTGDGRETRMVREVPPPAPNQPFGTGGVSNAGVPMLGASAAPLVVIAAGPGSKRSLRSDLLTLGRPLPAVRLGSRAERGIARTESAACRRRRLSFELGPERTGGATGPRPSTWGAS
jgi:hypothetical protein